MPDEVLDIQMIGDSEHITIGLSGRVALQSEGEIHRTLPIYPFHETIFFLDNNFPALKTDMGLVWGPL